MIGKSLFGRSLCSVLAGSFEAVPARAECFCRLGRIIHALFIWREITAKNVQVFCMNICTSAAPPSDDAGFANSHVIVILLHCCSGGSSECKALL